MKNIYTLVHGTRSSNVCYKETGEKALHYEDKSDSFQKGGKENLIFYKEFSFLYKLKILLQPLFNT